MLSQNLREVESNIKSACERVGRARESVTLIAVSKTQPVSAIEEAYALGIRDFGENKVKEMLGKEPQLPADIRWHLIGHLQTNKVKHAVRQFDLIHSVDSVSLAEVIDKEFAKKDFIARILIEVNVAKEDSKSGFYIEELEEKVAEMAKLSHIEIRGLMTVAPFTDNPEENRPVFRALRESLSSLQKKFPSLPLMELSMGMSGDYVVAIEEGATIIRVGSFIFGERNYQKL